LDELGPALDAALREVGFVTVRNHGIPDDVRAAYFDAMRAFFALPADAKSGIAIGNSPCHRGYVGFGTEALDGAGPNWPASDPRWRGIAPPSLACPSGCTRRWRSGSDCHRRSSTSSTAR
jgi:hypothetical protein